jgi:hypothetical protein
MSTKKQLRVEDCAYVCKCAGEYCQYGIPPTFQQLILQEDKARDKLRNDKK